MKCIVLVVLSFFLFIFPGLSTAEIVLTKISFSQLPRWRNDQHQKALSAFQESCREILKRPPAAAFSTNHFEAGKVARWQRTCRSALLINNASSTRARHFFEQQFQPYLVRTAAHHVGTFTGYYLPLLRANLKQEKNYQIPIYGLPHDMAFPYPDRAAINRGDIAGKAPVIAWANSLVELFFAQVQGSAMIKLPDNKQFLIGYSSSNGHPYTAIGKLLIAQKAIAQQDLSMHTIKVWLKKHPEHVTALLNQNASYIFFQKLNHIRPIGAEGVPLTPERSLAIDKRYVPLGVPVWVSTELPLDKNNFMPYQHLLIAQDAGTAIKGPIRGDIYFGPGERAAFYAGQMNSKGQYWLLLPK